MNLNRLEKSRPTRSANRVLLSGLLLCVTASAASAQFLCPPLEGEGGGLPSTTTEIAVIGGEGYLGGFAPIQLTMTNGEPGVASVIADICFDATKLDIADEEMSTGAPCEDDEDCPGGQTCGDDGTCQALVVTACEIDPRLDSSHMLSATSPIIPENPDNPLRLRLAILTIPPTPGQECTNNEECPEGQVCTELGRCNQACENDEQCPEGHRCKELGDQMVCSPLAEIGDGGLASCNFDVLATAEEGETPLTFGLLQVGDDSIPVPQEVPAVGIPGSIDIEPCEDDEDCPPGEICDVETGVCVEATPTPTGTPTTPGGGGTPTPTATGPTQTPTNTGPTATPTATGPTRTPTTPGGGNTATPTATGPTRTATPTEGGGNTPTRTPGGGSGEDDSCLIISPSPDSGTMRSWFLLIVPAFIVLMRRRRW